MAHSMAALLRISAAVAVAALSPGVAQAASLTGSSPGFHYFHKAGAGMAEHDAALVDCAVRTRALAQGAGISDDLLMQSAATGGYGGGFLGGALVGIIGAVIDGNEERQGAAANTENCMAVKGWSVIGLSQADGEAMEQPDDPPSIRGKVGPLVDASAPIGPVLRGPFANELAIGNFAVGTAKDLEEVSISVRAVKDQREAAVNAAGALKPPKPNPPKGVKAPKSLKGMKAAALAPAGPAKSYVFLRTIGKGVRPDGAMLALSRLGPDGNEIVYDGAPIAALIGGYLELAKNKIGADKVEDYLVELPPGTWKLAAISSGMAADLCFGAPAFRVGEGEVISIGVLTISELGGYPLAVDLDAARAALAANPALAEKVKSAEWTNGFTSDCFGSYAYAYEVPGAPFVDMNALARAAAQPATAPAPATAPIETAPQSDAPPEAAAEEPLATPADPEAETPPPGGP